MTLKRYKVASVLNIAGLTLAFAAFYVIASQVIYSLTYNRSLKDSERTYYVAALQRWNDEWSLNCPNPLCYEVADIMPEVEAIASMRPYQFPTKVYAKINDYHYEKFPYGITNCNFSITDVFDFNVIFAGKPFQRLVVVHLLMLHDEVYGISAFAASEAFAESFGGRNIEGRSLVIVERT